jgi:hypothetical protein
VQRLYFLGFEIDDDMNFYPYRCTYDLECYFNKFQDHNSDSNTFYESQLVPASISVASNLPGGDETPYNKSRCFVSTGDPKEFLRKAVDYMNTLSDHAYELLSEGKYKALLTKLRALADQEPYLKRMEGKSRSMQRHIRIKMKAKTGKWVELLNQLESWLHTIPVLGFNSVSTYIHTSLFTVFTFMV